MLQFPVLKHLLGIGDLSNEEILALLDAAQKLMDEAKGPSRCAALSDALRGRNVVTLFFENSTRTLASFEMAAKRLGANVINMALRHSSVHKGETLLDTAATLNAMAPDLLIVRHDAAGVAELLAQKVTASVVNAGDGAHEHPTQALLDALTIRRCFGRIRDLVITICGDIRYSRVARSNLLLLGRLGARLRVVSPKTLLPDGIENFGAEIYTDLAEAMRGADVVMMLRLQTERMQGHRIPSGAEYFRAFGLSKEKMIHAKASVLIMHPGPINRGIEIEGELADGPQSLITEQVFSGVMMRMAVLCSLGQGRNGGGS